MENRIKAGDAIIRVAGKMVPLRRLVNAALAGDDRDKERLFVELEIILLRHELALLGSKRGGKK